MAVSREEKLHFQGEQIAAIEEAFAHFDKNNDGHISVDEFGQLMGSLGERTSDDKIREMIKEWDCDGDGSINFNEFLHAMAKMITDIGSEDRLQEAFNLFDKDGNGFITPEELCNIMSSLGHDLDKDQINEMISEADMDDDGKISFCEFKKLMNT